jgi:hypothetical protein
MFHTTKVIILQWKWYTVGTPNPDPVMPDVVLYPDADFQWWFYKGQKTKSTQCTCTQREHSTAYTWHVDINCLHITYRESEVTLCNGGGALFQMNWIIKPTVNPSFVVNRHCVCKQLFTVSWYFFRLAVRVELYIEWRQDFAVRCYCTHKRELNIYALKSYYNKPLR